jgi:diguanylate cyclase (GGDEF)-like protein
MRAAEALLLAAYDERAVLASATSLLGDHFGYGRRYILLHQKATDELVMGFTGGDGADDPDVLRWQRKVGEGLSGIAAQTRRIVNVGDISADDRVIMVEKGQVSRICVPIVVRDELLGVLVLESPERDAFSSRDEEVLTAFAEITALALIHARSDRRRQIDIAQLHVVSEVATAAARLDLSASLKAAAEGFQRATESGATTIYLWDPATSSLSVAMMIVDGRHFPSAYEASARAVPLAFGEGLAGWAAQQRRPLLIDDVQNDPRARLIGPSLPDRSAIVIPLVVEERLLGVIRTIKLGLASYTQEHFRFAQTLASQIALLIAAAKARTDERARLAELSALHTVSRSLAEATRLGEVLGRVVDGAIRLTDAEGGLIWRIDDQGSFVLGASQGLPAKKIAERPPNARTSVSAKIMASGQPMRIADVRSVSHGRWPEVVPHIRALLGIPLRSEGRAYGSLIVVHPVIGHFTTDHERLLEVVAAQGAAAIARAAALEEAERLAITDALTGLFNARYFTDRLAVELERAKRYGRSLALLMVDSDALKLVNDRQGHAAGNDLLVNLARSIRQSVRASDLIARFGGDEFVILQPETTVKPATLIAERIREAAHAASDAAGIERSVSVGVAVYPDDATDGQSLFAQADAALYRAKKLGKNRVVTASS